MAGQRKIFETRRDLADEGIDLRSASPDRARDHGPARKEISIVKRMAIVKEEVSVVREMVAKA